MDHEQIIKKVSVRESLPLVTTDLIIRDSLKNAVRVLVNTDIGEVEIPGFGKIILSENKLRKRLDKYYGIQQIYEQRVLNHEAGLEVMNEKDLKTLYKRIRNITNDISNLERKYSRLKVN